MPITFDTLDELKAFYRAFSLDSEKNPSRSKLGMVTDTDTEASPAKRGRKPGSQNGAAISPMKRGRKPGAISSTKAKPEPKQKRDKSNTLTAKIQNAIRQFIDHKESFTANDVYDVLAKKETDINKQSVITSVLKQMNTTFSKIKVTERPGNGPRPVKLYNA